MKTTNFYIFILALFLSLTASGQTKIEELTKSLIDSSLNETQQSEVFYNWITHNIKYDLDALKRFESNYSATPDEILKKGKGVCYHYSKLFQAMCETAGIEVYTITGYSKGYRFNKEKPLLQSNHAWNVIHADSSWKHVDCTWGSGHLIYKPSTLRKVIYKTTLIPYTNSKVVLINEPDSNYFDIPVDKLIETHYPSDPKWFFSATPISVACFKNDTCKDLTQYTNYNEEIKRIRNKAENYQYIAEGENALKYNKYNYKNLASAYYEKCQNYNLDEEITKSNKYSFGSYLKDFDTITYAIEKHLYLNDSIYRSRKDELKNISRTQKRLTNKIISAANKATDTHRSSQDKIVGKNSSYEKKAQKYQLNIGRTEIKKIDIPLPHPLSFTDTIAYLKLFDDISNQREHRPELYETLDSIMAIVDNFTTMDARIDDSISTANTLFKTNIDVLYNTILNSDETLIKSYVDSLQVVYDDILEFMDDKKGAKSDLQNSGRDYYAASLELEKSLKTEIGSLSKLIDITNNSDSIVNLYNKQLDELISCYENAISFTGKLMTHNNSQSNIRDANLAALKAQKKSINKENKFFTAWVDYTMEFDEKEFNAEKQESKAIRSFALKGRKKVELKLDRYKE